MNPNFNWSMVISAGAAAAQTDAGRYDAGAETREDGRFQSNVLKGTPAKRPQGHNRRLATHALRIWRLAAMNEGHRRIRLGDGRTWFSWNDEVHPVMSALLSTELESQALH